MPNIIVLALFAEELCQNSSSEDTLWWEYTNKETRDVLAVSLINFCLISTGNQQSQQKDTWLQWRKLLLIVLITIDLKYY